MQPTLKCHWPLLAALILVLLLVQLAFPALAAGWAPRPYVPASKRDFTGIWEHAGSFGWRQDRPLGAAQQPPFTPGYLQIWQQTLRDQADGKQLSDPVSACLPPGMPRMMSMPYPMEITQNRMQLNIYSEWMEQLRRVFIDGRPHPEELDATYNGHSIGHYVGNALHVDTIGLRGDTPVDVGMPHSAAMRVRERLWLEDSNTLKDEITLIDAEAFTEPWVTVKTFKRAPPALNIMSWACLENNRNPIDAAGHIGFTLKEDSKP
jgi:hypothetical protein